MMGLSPFRASSCICDEPSSLPSFLEPSIIEKVVAKVKEVLVIKKKEHYFEIVRTTEYNGYVIAELRFPNFKNYGGRKVCVYRGTKKHLLNERYLDPHFCEGKHLSPLARFVPTEEGWNMAMIMVQNL